MENVQAYIESGILELYVLGNLTPEEKLQVEGMMSAHQTVRAEVDEIERALEVYAHKNAVEPADDKRTRILNSLITNLADDNSFKSGKVLEDNIIALPRANNFYKYAFAASLALLIGATTALYMYITSWSNQITNC